MKIKTIAHIHFQKYSWEEKGEYRVASFKLDDNENRTYVGEQEIEIEVPENYDPRAQQIAALEALKQKVMADYHKSVMEINDRINKLLALEAA
jgi:N-acetyl-anhydromuramyl-L-alanine amidase AmpD